MLCKQISFCLLAFALMGLIPALVSAQTFDKGQIEGIIYDETGAVLPAVSLTLTNSATGLQRSLASDDGGRYVAALLPVGEYTIEAMLSGFATTRVTGVVVAVGRSTVVNITMRVAPVAETVQVVAEVSPVDVTQTGTNSIIGDRSIGDLPISGRDYRDFVELTPTAQVTPGLRSPIRLGGQVGEYTAFLIDAADSTNTFFGEFFGSLETKNFTLPIDAVKEFQVRATGFSAEFGRSTGGLINVVTKSGTNDYHGSAHYFLQSEELWDNKTLKGGTRAAPFEIVTPAPFQTRHQFGGTLGGPIKKEKAFFFFAIDRQKQFGPLTVKFSRAVPPGIGIPHQGIADIAALEGKIRQSQNLLTPFGRVDWHVTEKHLYSGRLNFTRNATTNFTGGRGQIIINAPENNLEDFTNQGVSTVHSVTSNFSARLLNEARFNFSRETRPRDAKGKAPEVWIFDTGFFGHRFFLPIRSDHLRYQFIDNVGFVFKNHDIKTGIDYNASGTVNDSFIGFANGAYAFGTLEDFVARRPLFLLQLVGINGFTAEESGFIKSFWQHELAWYLQDNYKPHPNLTLNLGLRLDLLWNPQPKFPIVGKRVALGKPRREGNSFAVDFGPVPQGIPNDFNNWGPRVGFAYDILGKGKTVLRGGLGVYYGRPATIFMAEPLSGVGFRSAGVLFIPFFGSQTDLTGLGLTFPNLLPSKVEPGSPVSRIVPPPNIRYVDPDFESARSFNLQIGGEHELVRNLSFELNYNYTRSDNLRIGGYWNSRYDRNIFPPKQVDQFGRSVNLGVNPFDTSTRPDPTIGIADALTSFGRGRYHAFTVRLKKTFSRGHMFDINYVLSKNDDNASNDRDTDAMFPPSDPFNLDIDFGRSQLDIRHNFSFYGAVELPARFTFSSIIRARSGAAFPAFIPVDQDINGDARLGGDGLFPPPDRPVFNGKLLPRFPARQPAFFTWDVRLTRDINLGTERAKLQLMFELFNLLNNSNKFSDTALSPSNAIVGLRNGEAVLDVPNYRRLDRSFPPLSAQFGARITF